MTEHLPLEHSQWDFEATVKEEALCLEESLVRFVDGALSHPYGFRHESLVLALRTMADDIEDAYEGVDDESDS